jgi:speckle-type POZ protein
MLLESKSRKVNIFDVEIDVFKQFLVFLYTGNAPRLWEKTITRLLFELADKYGASTLKEQCFELLPTQIDIENVIIDKLVWANFH